MNAKYIAIIALVLMISAGFFFAFANQKKETAPTIKVDGFTQKANVWEKIQVKAIATDETEITKITSKTLFETLEQNCGKKECEVIFTHTFTAPGTHQIELTAQNNTGKTTTQKLLVQVFQNQKTCIDQTETGKCSKNKPKFCLEKNLVDKCSQCGCTAGTQCENEHCAPISLQLEIISAEPLPAGIVRPQTEVSIKATLKNTENELAAKGAAYKLRAKLSGPTILEFEQTISLEKDLQQNETATALIKASKLPEGVYSLELSIEANNEIFSSIILQNFAESSTETTPPQAPSGLASQLIADGAKLSWNKNTESDLAGYKIYKSKTAEPTHITYSLLQTTDQNATEITITRLEQGSHYFVMKAFDFLGNESKYSQNIKVEKG